MQHSTASGIAIRQADMSDAEQIAALSAQLGYPSTSADTQARIAAMQNSPMDGVFVAETAGVVIGWVHVYLNQSLVMETYAEIGGLVVDEAQRGHSVGLLLLSAAEDWVRGRGCTILRVHSNVIRERAHGFYRRHGYTLVKTQVVFHKDL
jgi:GNAT superfamily N-acetyltransferase